MLPPFLHALIYFISVDRVPATCVALQQMLDILRWGNGCGPALGRLCGGGQKEFKLQSVTNSATTRGAEMEEARRGGNRGPVSAGRLVEV